MKYVKWTEDDISGLCLSYLATEIDDNGKVCREVGANSRGVIVHQFPNAKFPKGERGYFDLQLVETEDLQSNMSSSAFEELWRNL